MMVFFMDEIAAMTSEPKSCPDCGLQRRQLMAAAMLTGLTPWTAALAGSCDAQALQAAQAVAAARDVCWECLQRRAQQRSPFVNREGA